MADALDTLARLRRLEADQARRALGEAIAEEGRARAAAADALAARARETALAGSDAADPLARAFAAWLPASARAIETAQDACRRRAEATQAARGLLATHKAALEAVEKLAAERDQARRREQARRAQLRLDEVGHRGKNG